MEHDPDKSLPMSDDAKASESIKTRVRIELKHYFSISTYLFICFFVLMTYEASFSQNPREQLLASLGMILGKALVIGKFVLIGDALGVCASQRSASRDDLGSTSQTSVPDRRRKVLALWWCNEDHCRHRTARGDRADSSAFSMHGSAWSRASPTGAASAGWHNPAFID